jgi:WhiB family redox-sensing transcriptional regulator
VAAALLAVVTPPDWQAGAACRVAVGAGTATADLWFSVDKVAQAAAARICGDCPVRVECLAWALQHGEEHGVWGGRTEKQRRAIQRAAVRRGVARAR